MQDPTSCPVTSGGAAATMTAVWNTNRSSRSVIRWKSSRDWRYSWPAPCWQIPVRANRNIEPRGSSWDCCCWKINLHRWLWLPARGRSLAASSLLLTFIYLLCKPWHENVPKVRRPIGNVAPPRTQYVPVVTIYWAAYHTRTVDIFIYVHALIGKIKW